MFDHIRSDLRAQRGTRGCAGSLVLLVYRYGRWRYTVRPAIVRKFCSLVYKILYRWVQVLTGMELPCEAHIGKNFVIEHAAGNVISGDARFGDHCRVRGGVVVGLNRVEERGSPCIGNHVDIGPGARLLGPITIGDNVSIGANSVVIRDVPANSLAMGIPAVTEPWVTRPTSAARRQARHALGEEPSPQTSTSP